MKQSYPIRIDKESMAYASGMNLGISTKVAIEISSFIRGKALSSAIARLERVIKMKEAVPYKRFNGDVGHKPGIGPGRYPIKACTEFIRILKNARANAIDKGLSDETLIITHISANKAAQQWKNGRQSRRKMKRTHLKVVLTESEDLKKKASKKKPEQKPERVEQPKEKVVPSPKKADGISSQPQKKPAEVQSRVDGESKKEAKEEPAEKPKGKKAEDQGRADGESKKEAKEEPTEKPKGNKEEAKSPSQ